MFTSVGGTASEDAIAALAENCSSQKWNDLKLQSQETEHSAG